MEGSCEYIEYAVAHSQLGVAIQLRGWVGCEKLLTVKTYHVTKYDLVLIPGLIHCYGLRIGAGGRHL